MQKAIPYYRVSTPRQGKSGLGLEAQQTAVRDYARMFGLILMGEFIEIETGKSNRRPVLQKALRCCRRQKAILLIAKLDRLGRNVAFISQLMDADIEFRAVDNPTAGRLVLHIMAAFAEHEREQISERTKAALLSAKNRGKQLGRYGRDVLSQRNKQAAIDFAAKMQPLFSQLMREGYKTVRGLTAELNRRKVKTYTGGKSKWHTRSVFSVLKRIEQLHTKQLHTI